MQKKKQKKGISLIVLIITIIVMIILAATIIISLNNNGIIDKASEAVDKTNEKQVEELANLAWADAYAENVGKSNEELLQALKTSVEKALSNNNVNKEDYGMKVTTTGVTIAKGWLQTSDRTVVKGDTVLNIGDSISYDETKGGTVTVEKDVDWKVLGAENGELLIMSATNITSTFGLGNSTNLEKVKTDYQTGISQLNEICEPYGKGEKATGARSITVEDVDRVTGYDKTTYGKGTIEEYGNIVTYSYNETNKPAYSGTNRVNGKLEAEHSSGFHWFDIGNIYHGVSNVTANSSGVITADGIEAKVKSTNYDYRANIETDLQTEAPNAYNMLFGSNSDNIYWLASSYVKPTSYCVYFGFRLVYYGSVHSTVSGRYLMSSRGEINRLTESVRAVVQLSQDTTLTGSSAEGWNIE